MSDLANTVVAIDLDDEVLYMRQAAERRLNAGLDKQTAIVRRWVEQQNEYVAH